MEEIPNPENIESEIERLLDELYTYADLIDDESILINGEPLADAWWRIEMEARVGLYRDQALEGLREFINELTKIRGKSE